MASTIGIKIANGDFYSILEESSTVKKRLILTTVHDNQKSVQIDLYKSALKTMADASYIGSLVVENIKPKPKGDPSIELIISSNAEGEISADATDLDAPPGSEQHHLSVSLQSLDEASREYDIPDFELDSHEPPPQGLYERASSVNKQESRKKFPWLLVVLILIILIFLGLLAWCQLRRGKPGTAAGSPKPAQTTERPAGQTGSGPAPSASAQTGTGQSTPPAGSQSGTVPVIQAPPPSSVPAQETPARPSAGRTRPAPPVASYSVPQTIPPEGVPYKIRWGDTLWDISEAFYRNPWLYPRIARFNNIRNPDLIISGTTIRIPPRN
ncbi:Hsp70 family protein [Breznakiella homolactica]|uniref:LysM peptidoglycan-binding domain-containing protein n=1 Tax=Breznakiella homolactica TaxID=2798577 RepID=A0A7T7XQB7_9SPIR|nr:Hsp70 family protein [Breznakiella homolactica]QQO10438.1 LysM peptidoglycan-binding domain-containing protein [Breznakiella homolactica]